MCDTGYLEGELFSFPLGGISLPVRVRERKLRVSSMCVFTCSYHIKQGAGPVHTNTHYLLRLKMVQQKNGTEFGDLPGL